MFNRKIAILAIILAGFFANITFAQVYTNKEVGKKNQELADSLKKTEYPYILPIWGKKVAAKGYNLPYSAGIGVNYMWQESDIIIDNLFVGFNNGPQYNLDEIVRFNDAVSTLNGINIRPDVWVLPFLNVYAIFGKAKTSTSIDAGVYLPDTNNVWTEVVSLSTKAEFDATTFGFGMTPTMGVGGGWIALDMNCAWTDISALEKPAFSFVFGPRFGKSFKLKKEDRNISCWVGGFRLHLKSETAGSLNLNELFPMDELQTKVDDGLAKVDEAYTNVEAWWNNPETNQNNPINQAKYDAANSAIEKASGVLTSIDGALNDEQYASVQYSLEKKPKDMWNFVVGTQFQLNKHFMVRGEYGFLGSRQQFIGGLQYRFGL
jgi:opacity protein-like surface antigen